MYRQQEIRPDILRQIQYQKEISRITDKKTKLVADFRVKFGEFVDAEKKSFALYDAINWDAIDWHNMNDTERTQIATFHEAYQKVEKLGSILRDMFIVITGRKIAVRDFKPVAPQSYKNPRHH